MARLTAPDQATEAEFTVVTPTAAFPFSFSIFAKADLTVIVDGVTLDQSAFTFTGTLLDGGGYDGGTITLNTAVDDVTVRIERNVAPARTSNFAPAASTPVGSVDQAFNRLTMVQQDQSRRVGDTEAALDAFAEDVAAVEEDRAAVQAIFDVAGEVQSGASVTYLGAGTGAVVRSVQTKLRDLPVSVQDFGAVGDGVTNDRAAIQAALDAVNNAGGGVVYLPMKQYLLGTTGLTMRGNVVLHGAVGRFAGNPGGPGVRGTTLIYSGTGTAIFGQNILDSQILNIDINCTSATGSSVRGIHFSGVWKTTLRNVIIRGVTPAKGYGILYDTVGVSGPFGAQHNYFEEVECADGIIRLQGVDGGDACTTNVFNTIRGYQYQFIHSQGVCMNATAEGWVTGPGYLFDGAGTDFTMVGCDIEGSGSPGIQITNGADVREIGTVWKGFTGAERVDGGTASLRSYGGAIEFKAALVANTPRLTSTHGNTDADFHIEYLVPTNITGSEQTGYVRRHRMIGGVDYVYDQGDQWAVFTKTVNVATTSQVTLASLIVAPAEGNIIEVTARGFQGGDGWFNITRTAVVINGNPLIIEQPAQTTAGALNQLSFAADDANDLVLVRWVATTASSTDVRITVRVLGTYAGYT